MYYQGIYHVAMADVDGDHDLDMITANWYSSEVSVLTNSGPATFLNTQNVSVPAEAYFVAAGHLDGDPSLGLPDIVGVGNVFGDTLFVLRNDGSGGFFFDSSYYWVPGTGAYNLALGDVDFDGDLDAVVPLFGVSESSQQIVVLLYDSWSHQFEVAETYSVLSEPIRVELADLDGDGDLDIATTTQSPAISLLWGDGFGGFGPGLVLPIGNFYQLVAGDLNGDCAVDLMDGGTIFLNLCPPSGADSDGDGLPDLCDPCPFLAGPCPDLDGDGFVNGADLGILLGAWGPCDGCPPDLDGDGVVDGADLGTLLGSWTG